MRKNNEELHRETNAAFAFAVVLLNVLIVMVLCVSVWSMQSILSQSDSLGLLLRDSAIYR